MAGSNAAGFLLGTSFLTFVFLGTLYMQQVLGFSAIATGAAWMTALVTSLAFAGLSQKIVTRTSAKAVMAIGMALIGAGMLWAAQAPPNGSFWPDLAGPFFVAGIGTAFAFIPISIGALTGVTERDAGVASGLLNTTQNLGGAIGVAVASSIAASRFHTLSHHGYTTAAALTGGFRLALWVCGLAGLAAVPVAFGLIRRHQKAPTPAALGTAARESKDHRRPDVSRLPDARDPALPRSSRVGADRISPSAQRGVDHAPDVREAVPADQRG